MVKISLVIAGLLISFSVSVPAQLKRPATPLRFKPPVSKPVGDTGQSAVVIDETLSLLRSRPSLFSETIKRMTRGSRVQILGTTEADGVKFFKIAQPRATFGWIQSEAVFGNFRPSDEERLARLMQASTGFDQIEIAVEFFKLYPDSRFRPPVLLLFGDLLEEVAVKLTHDAASKLKRPEMAASGAPLHSYYLNFVSLDRYRKLGITFVFNSSTRSYHYDGTSWKEVVAKFSSSAEAAESQKRLNILQANMARVEAR